MENSYTPKIKLFAERDFGEKLNVTFEFIQENIKYLGKLILIINGPLSLILGFGYSYYMQNISKMATAGPESFTDPQSTQGMFSSLGVVIIAGFLLTYTFFALIYRYLELYQRLAPKEITVKVILRSILSDSSKLFGVSLVYYAILVAGMLFFVLPVFYVGVAFSLSFIIVIFEKGNIFKAVSRSFKLLKGAWWETFGFLIVLYIIQVAISLMFYIPMYGYMFSKMFSNAENPLAMFGSGDSLDTIILSVLMTIAYLGAFLASSISAIAISFQYFNQREKHEAVGLLDKIDHMTSNQ